MSISSPISPFDHGEEGWSMGSSRLTKQIREVSHFLKDLHVLLRFGELSRSPLQLTRIQIRQDTADCDWIARQQDPWDADLSRNIGRRHASLQALRDAIEVRALLFKSLPGLELATLRVYRNASAQTADLIIQGNVRRQDSAFRCVHSIAMRAKLLGFHFRLENDLLSRLNRDNSFKFGD